ncbi:MAG: protein-L-isoaspartate O-methyltransferase [Pirellulaceae bacterium]|nr:MAG: protein-L-isoaspartate O-methyltransferase [Pirellulaceae bacterium]
MQRSSIGTNNHRHSQSGALVLVAFAAVLVVAANQAWGQLPTAFDLARRRMVDEILIPSGIQHPGVLRAMAATPRHEFVPRQYHSQAYYDMALPIGAGQTISSPYIVAFMTQALDPQPTDRVLEIGTGSGYQAAVLSPLVKEVYTIEIVEELADRASRTLKRLGYKNVFVKTGDGFLGWPEHAPFDKIIVTCSPEQVPQPLVEQLAEGGMMVIPVGERYQQTLYLLRKENGRLVEKALQPTLFVPMTGRAEAERQVQPDPSRPTVVNGNFEQPLETGEYIPGWYYQRLATLVQGQAPEGEQFVRFENRTPGRPASLLQGFAIDGQSIRELRVEAWIRLQDVRQFHPQEFATIAISFYDVNRRDLGVQTLGPLTGTSPWRKVTGTFRVPAQAREALLRVGLFGAVGQMDIDDIRLIVNAGP